MDDLLVKGTDFVDLEQKITHCILQHCANNGFTLSVKKFEIRSAVEFVSFIIDCNGVSTSPK